LTGLARIPEQWWEMNQRMTLKVGKLTYEVQSDLVLASIAKVPLSRLTSLCHLSLFTSICQIPDFFLCDIIQTGDLNITGGFQAIQLNNCKNRVWKLVSKRREESVKEVVIGYIVPRTSSEWHVIENAWQNTYIARKADSRMAMNCQSYCYGILHFVLGSHLILQWNMSCFCLFVVLKSTDV
jgi:hypothetical protein